MLVFLFAPLLGALRAGPLGEFEAATDVGRTAHAGTVHFDPALFEYRITGGGANIWGKEDAFHFLRKEVTGDLALSFEAEWVGAGKSSHRKVCGMVRAGLDADAPYVDVVVHGNGLIEMQYRKVKGGETFGVGTPVTAPARVRIERDGEVFTVSVAKNGKSFHHVGSIALALPETVNVGIAVSAHDSGGHETAVVSRLLLKNRVPQPAEKRVRETSLETVAVATRLRRLVYRDRSTFEAPNWTRDGQHLLINRGGGIFSIPIGTGEPRRLDTGKVDRNNNDHGLSFDGRWLALSSSGGAAGSQIYVVPATGGEPRLVTPEGPSYWHGWSPDGTTLAYCARRNGNFDIYTIPIAGGPERRLTTYEGLDDGCEYTPDGTKIYFNSERTGVMQIWRMNPDGSGQELVTRDPNFADWFPHPSPDGKWLVFLSFDKTVKGHPANQNVTLRLMPLAGGEPRGIATLFGGQGTINVPSWSPDSAQVAFVSYRHVLP
jgi:hypothetical protein